MIAPVSAGNPAGFFARWRTYFAERFPPVQHGILIAAFCFGVQGHAAALDAAHWPLRLQTFLVAFATVFLLLLQLRILDEFKDYEEDCHWRPYRPVPRGLISLPELRRLWMLAAVIQVGLALALDFRLLAGLLAIWLYSALMGVEFFARSWLKAHPLIYMLSHIVIVPMMTLHVLACQRLELLLPGVVTLLAASYFAFCVIEVGRKIRAPADEEEGVETYSVLWGRTRALVAWLGFMVLASASAVLAASELRSAPCLAGLLALVLLLALRQAWSFRTQSAPGSGERINRLSALWTLALFLGLGLQALF